MNLFTDLLLHAVQTATTTSLTLLIQKHKELHGEEKNKQLREAIKNSFLLLKDVTDKTKNKTDDTVVQIVLTAVELSSKN